MDNIKEEILKNHIENMNKFCGENIGFKQGKEQLKMIHENYSKRFPAEEILYKNLIIQKNEINSEKYNENTQHWMKYFVSCSGSEWKELWQSL